MEKVTTWDLVKQNLKGGCIGLVVTMVLCLFAWGSIIKHNADFQASITTRYVETIIRNEVKTDKLVYAQMLTDRKAIGWCENMIPQATTLKQLAGATSNINSFKDAIKQNLYDYGPNVPSTNKEDAERVIEMYNKKYAELNSK